MKKGNNSFLRTIYEWLNKNHFAIILCCVWLITYIYTYCFIQALAQTEITVATVFKYLSPILIFVTAYLVYKITTTLLLIHKSKKHASSILSSNLTPFDQAYKLLQELDRIAVYEFEIPGFILWRIWIKRLNSIIDKHITDNVIQLSHEVTDNVIQLSHEVTDNVIQLSYEDHINFDKR